MNKLLESQIVQHLEEGTEIPASLSKLLKVIAQTYDQYENERERLKQSIRISTQELLDLNAQMRAEAEDAGKMIYEKLKESVDLLKEEKEDIMLDGSIEEKLLVIADLLKQETAKRKQAERKMDHRKAHLQASQRMARIGSWESTLDSIDDLSANPLFWSNETYRIFGFDPGETDVTNDLFFSRIHPDDIKTIIDADRWTIDTGIPTDIEYTVVLPGGVEKRVHERKELIYDAEGKPAKVFGTIQDITERHLQQKELEKVNRELRTLFENMNELFFSVDMTTYQLIQMSNSCENIYGRTLTEFRANPNLWLEVVLEEDKQIIHDNYAVMNAGRSFNQEYRILHVSGEVRWLQSTITPTLQEGKLIRVDGLTRDITSRKLAEIALRQSEDKFRSLIKNSSDGILVYDEDANANFASDSVYDITGFTPEEFINNSSAESIPPDELVKLTAMFRQVLSNGVVKDFTYQRKKKNGDLIWCEGTANNLLHDPAVKGVVINFRDITERVNAEKALRDSEHRFRSLILNSSDAITLSDKNLEMVFASDSLSRITGFDPAETIGTTIFTYAHPDDKVRVQDFLTSLLHNPGKSQTIEYRTLRKDGSYMWCERTSINLINDPALEGVVSNLRDITERKEHEQALRASNDELRKSNSELDRFVYSVSHDLRAPLSSIEGMICLSETETTEPQMLENLQLMKGSVRKLDSFILDILDYSANARMDIANEDICFNELVREIVANLKYMGADNRSVDMRVHIDHNARFTCDRRRINIILNNLIANAMRYQNPAVPDPFVEVTVEAAPGKAIIKIRDNGIGISSDHQAKVFDMFYRISTMSTGSGLGLYLVRETVEKLNGHLYLTSELGKGTEFIITIPNNIS